MRPYILKALLVKEARRHIANRGSLVLCLLLIVSALLLSVFNPGAGAGGTGGGGALIDGVHRCLVQYGEETPFIDGLKTDVPADLRPHLNFERIEGKNVESLLTYPPGVGAIQLRTVKRPDGTTLLNVDIWHPPEHPEAMAPYEAWFWRAARTSLQKLAEKQLKDVLVDPSKLSKPDTAGDDLWAVRDSYRQLSREYEALYGTSPAVDSAIKPLPVIEINRRGLGAKELDLRSAVATGMVVFALYFFCVYLLPTMTCEERERGVLLAQALSPAGPAEIVVAKFLFYPVLGILLAAVLAGIYKPAIVGTLFFWLAITALAAGFLGIGMTVATLAKTQRAAFMGSMCYLMSVSLILFISSQNGIPFLPWFFVEFHGPRIIHAAVGGEVQWQHWGHLIGSAGLGLTWMTLAGWLFRRRGWQ